jgi:toxin ParE1/3/4
VPDFQVNIDKRALKDIQNAIDYYDNQKVGLGRKFENTLNTYFESLERFPFFSVRYENVHVVAFTSSNKN